MGDELEKRLDAFERILGERLDAFEQRIKDHLDKTFRESGERIIAEFAKWGGE